MGNIVITFKGKSKVYTKTRNLHVWLSKQHILYSIKPTITHGEYHYHI